MFDLPVELTDPEMGQPFFHQAFSVTLQKATAWRTPTSAKLCDVILVIADVADEYGSTISRHTLNIATIGRPTICDISLKIG